MSDNNLKIYLALNYGSKLKQEYIKSDLNI